MARVIGWLFFIISISLIGLCYCAEEKKIDCSVRERQNPSYLINKSIELSRQINKPIVAMCER